MARRPGLRLCQAQQAQFAPGNGASRHRNAGWSLEHQTQFRGVRFRVVRLRVVRFRVVRFGVVRFGVVRLGVVEFGVIEFRVLELWAFGLGVVRFGRLAGGFLARLSRRQLGAPNRRSGPALGR
jgi:hypothetical protein